MVIRVSGTMAEAFVKRALYLAYIACGSTQGAGVFQSKSNATENDVWLNAVGSEDYDGFFKSSKPGDFYADYVFGRMIKWGCVYEDNVVDSSREEFDVSYNSFARKYKTVEELFKATAESLGCKYEVLDSPQRCAKCRGCLEETVITDYQTKIAGADVVVKNAVFLKCVICGEKWLDPRELTRWAEEQNAKFG